MDAAESLLACTGLRRVLAGKSPGKAAIARSVGLQGELKVAVLAYLQGEHSDAEPVGDVDLPKGLPEDSHGAVEGLDPEVGIAYGIAAARALAFLNGLIPRRALPGLTDKVADRTQGEKARFRRALQVVEDVMGVLGDIDSLSDDQIAAIRAVFPSLWSDLGLQAAEAMAEHNEDLSSRQERALGRLMGVSVVDVDSIQALYRQEKAEKQAQGGGQSVGSPLTTEVQRIAAK